MNTRNAALRAAGVVTAALIVLPLAACQTPSGSRGEQREPARVEAPAPTPRPSITFDFGSGDLTYRECVDGFLAQDVSLVSSQALCDTRWSPVMR